MKIALCGKMRSGKDTVAAILVDYHDYKEYKLGNGIAAVDSFLFSGELKMSKRERFQTIGQSMRKVNEDVWINSMINTINHTGGLDQNIVVSDVRQPNEVERLREYGFIIVKVNTFDEIRIERINKNEGYDEKAFNHETELSVDTLNVDMIMNNNGTLEELKSLTSLLARGISKQVLTTSEK